MVKSQKKLLIIVSILFLTAFLFNMHRRSYHYDFFRRMENRTFYFRHDNVPQVLLLDSKTLMANKARIKASDPSVMSAYKTLINQADKLLLIKPVSVMDKTQTPPSGDKHDYMSLAPYYWPDPTKPSGVPYKARDGLTNPESKSIPDRDNLNTMISAVSKLALAYYFSDDEKYANHAAVLLRTWFTDPHTRMNPNLNSAQGAKGRNSGSSGGIIDTNNLPQIIDSIGLLKNSTSFTDTDRSSLHEWFSEYFQWLLTSRFGKQEGNQQNNHGTWYDVQVVSYALYLNQFNKAQEVLEASRAKRIAVQISQDGNQPMEINRTNSWVYSIFNLQGLCELATLGNRANVDLWDFQTQDGRGIKKAIDFLEPYALKQKKWPYQEIIPLNQKTIITPLLQSAINYHDSSEWNDALQLEGGDSKKNINELLFSN